MIVVMAILLGISVMLALPSIKRIMKGDFSVVFWSMVALDLFIIFVAIKTRNLVIVVTVQVLANTLTNLLDQRRCDQIYAAALKQAQKKKHWWNRRVS